MRTLSSIYKNKPNYNKLHEFSSSKVHYNLSVYQIFPTFLATLTLQAQVLQNPYLNKKTIRNNNLEEIW